MPSLANRYDLHDILYSDAHVVAYRAHDRLLNRPVTIEVLQAQLAGDPAYVQRLIDKARHAALASLPYVAALYDQHTVDSRPFLVLEEPAGPALHEVAPLAMDQVVALIAALAESVQAALARRYPLPSINGQTVRIGAEGHFQVLDLGLEPTAASAPHAVAMLGGVLTSALRGAADIHGAPPLQRIAERAANGQFASPQALVDELRAVERRANQATTVIPRAQPTVDRGAMPHSPAADGGRRGTSAGVAPGVGRALLLKAVLGAVALALVLLLGGAFLRDRDEAGAEPPASSQPAIVDAPTASVAATVPAGERYVVAARGSQTVRVRSGPSTSAAQITSLRNGTVVQVISEPQPADGYRWVRIVADGVDGWCILEALRKQ